MGRNAHHHPAGEPSLRFLLGCSVLHRRVAGVDLPQFSGIDGLEHRSGFDTIDRYIALCLFSFSTGEVISVVEDCCFGISALDKALKNLRGRRVQGSLLTLVLVGIVILYKGLSALISMKEREGGVSTSVWDLVDGMVMQIILLFNMVVYTVFYMDCKDSQSKKLPLAGLELGYEKLPIKARSMS